MVIKLEESSNKQEHLLTESPRKTGEQLSEKIDICPLVEPEVAIHDESIQNIEQSKDGYETQEEFPDEINSDDIDYSNFRLCQ